MKEIISALCKAKLEFKPLVSDKKNAYAKYEYASLSAILASVDEALSKHGLTLVFTLDNRIVKGTLYHESGESISSEVALQHIEDANKEYADKALKLSPIQQLASVITSLRRYITMSLLGLAEDEGDELIDVKTQEWILTYMEDIGLTKVDGAGVVERIAGVRQRDQIPVAKLPAVITGLKQYAETRKPKAKPTKPTEPGTMEQNHENT